MNKITLSIMMLCLLAALTAKPEMVKVYGGWMQITDNEEESLEIKLSDFYLGKYEVTVAEFDEFVEDSGYVTTAEIKGWGFGLVGANWTEEEGLSWRNPGYDQEGNHPVASLSWYDAISYCNWLSAKEGLKPVYTIDKETPDPNNTNTYDNQRWTVTWNPKANGYRLPTTAEWEYAARNGGQNQNYVWGDIDFYEKVPEKLPANLADISFSEYYESMDEYAWSYLEDYDDGYEFSSPVGTFEPNSLGLYDMAGNVSELCWDWHNLDYMPENRSTDPKGPERGAHHAQRGSSWCDLMEESVVGYRRDLAEDYMTFSYIGMRLAKNAKK